jgi:microcin C transport system permease protein
MNWPTVHWNPVTLKRLRRFRLMKRAWYSFWILMALYAFSLGSELICNNAPLYVHFNGRSYFPVFRYYPDDTFTGSGKHTRADYKAIAASAFFKDHPGNFMLFPLIPHGPYEIIDPASIVVADAVTLRFEPVARMATVNLRPDYTIARSTDASHFFGVNDESIADTPFTNYWVLPAELLEAAAVRFRNETAEPVAVTLTNRSTPAVCADVALSQYEPRATAPTSVRLTFREITPAGEKEHSVRVERNLRVRTVAFKHWDRLDPGVRSNLTASAARRFVEPVEKQTVSVEGANYSVSFDKEDIRWPYGPVKSHWLGIDNAGRDVLARILYGLRTSMTFGFVLVILSMGLGIAVGSVQGYFGGRLDLCMQRFTEIWSALPFLYVMILMGAVYGRGFLLLIFCYAIFNWIGISYYMRAEFLRLRHQPFVEAAQSLGLPHGKVIFRHILPNALVPVITFFPFSLVGAIGSLAALDYLGFGLPPPTPSWGELLQQAQQFRWAWWLILYPSLALFIVMLLGVFVGEGVRNAYDPRPQTRIE